MLDKLHNCSSINNRQTGFQRLSNPSNCNSYHQPCERYLPGEGTVWTRHVTDSLVYSSSMAENNELAKRFQAMKSKSREDLDTIIKSTPTKPSSGNKAPIKCEFCDSSDCTGDHWYEEIGSVRGYSHAYANVQEVAVTGVPNDLRERLRTVEATQNIMRKELTDAQALWMSEMKQLKDMNSALRDLLKESMTNFIQVSQKTLAATDTLGQMITSTRKALKTEIRNIGSSGGSGHSQPTRKGKNDLPHL